MGQNRLIDPVKRDFVVEGGTFVPSDDIDTKAYMVLKIPETLWLYGLPGQGSQLWRLRNVKRTSDIEQTFIEISEKAIQSQLVDSQQALAVRAYNLESSRTGTSNQVNVFPQATSISSQFKLNPL